MATGTLTGQTIANTYKALLKITGTTAGGETLHATNQIVIEDGDGNPFPLSAAQDALMITSTNRLEFGDTCTYIFQSADGVLDLVSDTEIELNATTLDINAAVDISGTLTVGGNIDFNSGTIDLSTQTVDVTLNAAADALNFDSNTLSIDASNNRVGIGTATPGYPLDVQTTGENVAQFKSSDDTAQIVIADNGAVLFVGTSDTGGASGVGNGWIGFTSGESSNNLIIQANGRVGIGDTDPTARLSVYEDISTQVVKIIQGHATGPALEISNAHTMTDGNIVQIGCKRATNSGYDFLETQSDTDNPTEIEHRLIGDGSSAQDSGTTWGSGADYAEYFETSDGNPIAPGTTVVLVNGKIREAEDGETPFGVTRPEKAPCALGNSAWNKWQGKYLKSPYGEYDLDGNGYRKLNPNFVENLDQDEEQIYTPRSERDEWEVVGLLGQIPINNNQIISTSWIKMWKVTDDVDMYYVFPSA